MHRSDTAFGDTIIIIVKSGKHTDTQTHRHTHTHTHTPHTHTHTHTHPQAIRDSVCSFPVTGKSNNHTKLDKLERVFLVSLAARLIEN